MIFIVSQMIHILNFFSRDIFKVIKIRLTFEQFFECIVQVFLKYESKKE